MIIDTISYNNEHELFDIRYNILKDFVDVFVVCEAPLTFSGKPKPLYFEKIKEKYDKVRYYVIDENDQTLWDMARNSPNTIGAEHWKREFVQKESIKKALSFAKNNDIIFIGDCDEIWNPEVVFAKDFGFNRLTKLKQIVYTYYLNQRSSEKWHGTLMCEGGIVKSSILNHLRTAWRDVYEGHTNAGWHFTSLKKNLKQKLLDSYTEETYAHPAIIQNLKNNIENDKDFLGRQFTYWVSEEDWPKYLKDNKHKYAHLCKQTAN